MLISVAFAAQMGYYLPRTQDWEGLCVANVEEKKDLQRTYGMLQLAKAMRLSENPERARDAG